jgi:hypothetical protein
LAAAVRPALAVHPARDRTQITRAGWSDREPFLKAWACSDRNDAIFVGNHLPNPMA